MKNADHQVKGLNPDEGPEIPPNFEGGGRNEIGSDLLAQVPMTPEEIQADVTVEKLSRMNLQEYVELLRRIPPRFITHVTRQGVRDNFTHHAGGYGQFNRGFEKILESGELNCELQTLMRGEVSQETVKRVLKEVLGIPGSEDLSTAEARDRVDTFLNHTPAFSQFVPNEFTDKTALHVAIDYVADHYYGAERGNDVFVVWPGALAASQYQIAGQQFKVPAGMKLEDWQLHNQFNDFWLKAEEEMGHLPLDTGIVFIPKNVPVDAQTGSRYKLVDNEPAPNSTQIVAINAVANDIKNQMDLDQLRNNLYDLQDALATVQNLNAEVSNRESSWHYGGASKRDQLAEARVKLEALQASLRAFFDLCRQHGLNDPRFFQIFEDPHGPWQSVHWLINEAEKETPLNIDDPNSGWMVQMGIDDNMRLMGMQFELAERTIPSEEYWEAYFAQNGNRPSKVIYYDSASPTDALNEFKVRIGLTEDQSPIDLRDAFQGNFVSTQEMSDGEAERRRTFQAINGQILPDLLAA